MCKLSAKILDFFIFIISVLGQRSRRSTIVFWDFFDFSFTESLVDKAFSVNFRFADLGLQKIGDSGKFARDQTKYQGYKLKNIFFRIVIT